MVAKVRVLFVCIHNSARSQIAETYLNHFAGKMFEAESAGIEPGSLNPYVIEVLKEEGLDISNNITKSVFDFFKEGRVFNYVITVCDKEAAERCPIFPGISQKINWSFPDPSKLQGNDEDKLNGTREIRDQIKKKIKEWIPEIIEKIEKDI